MKFKFVVIFSALFIISLAKQTEFNGENKFKDEGIHKETVEVINRRGIQEKAKENHVSVQKIAGLQHVRRLERKRGNPSQERKKRNAIRKIISGIKNGEDLYNNRELKRALANGYQDDGKVTVRKRGWLRRKWRRFKKKARKLKRFVIRAAKGAIRMGIKVAKIAWKYKYKLAALYPPLAIPLKILGKAKKREIEAK